MSAAASTPPASPTRRPAAWSRVLQEVVNPADAVAVEGLCQLLRAGGADLYGQDEADLALLPTLTRTWMLRGAQLRVRAPGTNEKRSVSVAIDLGDGALIWFNDRRRSAAQFCATVAACVRRSVKRGRIAILLVDNAASHRLGKTGWVRQLLDGLRGQVVLVFQPPYCPEAQPAERLWLPWRANVTHNHRRADLETLKQDSNAWLQRMAADPAAVLRAVGQKLACSPVSIAA